MKRHTSISIIRIVVIFIFFTFSTGILLSQKGKSKPIQTDPNIAAWKRLNDLQTIGAVKGVKMVKGGSVLMELQMANIKDVLEKAGINEEVTIECIGTGGTVLANLGTYKPDAVQQKSKSPVSPKSINPQPDSFRTSHFNSIPMIKNIASDSIKAKKLEKDSTLNKLVFKNAKGEVKATLHVKFFFTHKTAKVKKNKK